MGQDISYQLLLALDRPLFLQVGRLGAFDFPAGRYVYTGSARRHLEARIARHQRRAKPLRWHIDALTSVPECRLMEVIRSPVPECALNQMTGGVVLIPGFGASDCTSGCGSHLKYLGK